MDRKNDLSRPLEELHSNEALKHRSRFLRGTLESSLREPTSASIDHDDSLLTKFFGIYQQDDRDLREERRLSRLEPDYQFMVRVRLPGGVCTPAQWLAFDRLSQENADGTLRLTTRQTFQFHGIRKKNLRKHLQGLNAAGLDTVAACGERARRRRHGHDAQRAGHVSPSRRARRLLRAGGRRRRRRAHARDSARFR